MFEKGRHHYDHTSGSCSSSVDRRSRSGSLDLDLMPGRTPAFLFLGLAAPRLFHHGRIAFTGELAVAGNRARGMGSQQKAVIGGFIKDFTEGGAERLDCSFEPTEQTL